MNIPPATIQPTQITQVNTSAQTARELQQCFATLNQVIQVLNVLLALDGNLETQIKKLFSDVAGIGRLVPFDGQSSHDGAGSYLTNSCLSDWPGEAYSRPFVIGATVSSTNYAQLTLTPGSTASPGTTVLAEAAGPLSVYDGAVYLDASAHFGMSTNATNLTLLAGSGIVTTSQTLDATAFSVAGTAGGDYSSAGIVFSKGLYISGSIGSSTPGGNVPEVGDTDFYVRTLYGGSGSPVVGTWQKLSVWFPGILANTVTSAQWAGSTHLTTVGIVTTGTWEAAINTSASTTIGACTLGAITGTSATFSTTLGVTGLSTLHATLCTTLGASGNSTVGGTLGVTGATTLSSTLSAGATTVSSTLGVTGAATLSSTLTVTGVTTLNGNVSGPSTMTLGGTFAAVTFAAGIIIEGGFGGLTTPNMYVTNIQPNTNISTTFTFLDPSGQTEMGIATGSHTITFGSSTTVVVAYNATVGGTLGVTGDSTFASTVQITGAMTCLSTLAVDGISSLAAVGCTTVTASGAISAASLSVSGTLQTTGGYVIGAVVAGQPAVNSGALSLRSASGHDSTAGVTVNNYGGNVTACNFDTTNGIVYPTRLVLPAG